jgi:hypothetical protein
MWSDSDTTGNRAQPDFGDIELVQPSKEGGRRRAAVGSESDVYGQGVLNAMVEDEVGLHALPRDQHAIG